MNEKLYNILKDKGVNLPPNLDDFNKMIEEDEKLKNNLSKFITQNNLDISLESKKKSLFSESPSQETSTEFQDEDEDGVFGTVSDYLSNVFSSFKRGYARGSAAEEATDILNPLAEVDYQQIAETEKTLEVLEDNKSEVLKDFNGSDLKVESLLDSFEMPSGRGDVLSINNIKIIDDSYNANPESVKAALDHLNSFNGHRKLFVFGDMKELGDNEVNLHTEIGQYAEGKTDIILTVGKLAENAQSNSNNFALSLHFNDNISLLEKLTELLKDGDIILIKGSRSMQLDQLINELKNVK